MGVTSANIGLTDNTRINGATDDTDIGNVGDRLKVDATFSSLGTVKNYFSNVTAIASSASADILTYTVPVGKIAYLLRADLSGTNIALYEAKLNGSVLARTRTYFGGDFTKSIDFGRTTADSIPLVAGDIVKLSVTNFRPLSADFEARLQYIEV